MKIRFTCAVAYAFAAFSAIAVWSSALAEEERQIQSLPLLPKYRQECSTCHIAYPPGMLPADSWQRILNGLDHHFGTNASLDPPSVKQLHGWLTAHAAKAQPVTSVPPEDRITRSTWFMSVHDEVPASTWRNPAIKSASNCAACHTHADQGNFDERYARIPR